MLSCKEITELAAEAAKGAPASETRAQLEAHLAGCPGCRAWLKQLDLAGAAIRSLPAPELPVNLQDKLLSRFDEWQAARHASASPAPAGSVAAHGRYTWEALIAVVGVAALLLGMARHPSRAVADWVVAMGLAAGAVVLAFVARRLTPRVALAAVSASLVAAVIRGGPGGFEPGEGLECLLVEAAASVVVAGTAWLAGRRAPEPVSLGPWAIAGALSGSAALQLACGAHLSLAHLVTFHAGGVLLIAGAAMLGGGLRPQVG